VGLHHADRHAVHQHLAGDLPDSHAGAADHDRSQQQRARYRGDVAINAIWYRRYRPALPSTLLLFIRRSSAPAWLGLAQACGEAPKSGAKFGLAIHTIQFGPGAKYPQYKTPPKMGFWEIP
jgi:hypothetical protein